LDFAVPGGNRVLCALACVISRCVFRCRGGAMTHNPLVSVEYISGRWCKFGRIAFKSCSYVAIHNKITTEERRAEEQWSEARQMENEIADGDDGSLTSTDMESEDDVETRLHEASMEEQQVSLQDISIWTLLGDPEIIADAPLHRALSALVIEVD